MKISRTFFALIYVALMFLAGALYSARLGQQIRDDEKTKCLQGIETQGCFAISFSHQEVENNSADYIAFGLFILAISTIVAAILTRKLSD